MKNIEKIFKFLKTLDIDLTEDLMKEKFNSYLDENSFNINKNLILGLIDNEDFMENLSLLHEIEEYLIDNIKDSLKEENQELLNIKGKVSYINLGAGFWAITSNEDKWKPIHFPEDLKEDGIEVEMTFRIISNINTSLMWGKNIEILSYEKTQK